MFRSLDADRNGQVTLIEIRPMAEARFRGMDVNGDGAVVREELRAHGPQHGHRGDGPRGEGPRGEGPRGGGPRGEAPATPLLR